MEEAPLLKKGRCSSSAAEDDQMAREDKEEEADQTRNNPSPASLPHAQGSAAGKKERSSTAMEAAAADSSSGQPSSSTAKKQKEAELESTRAEMGQVLEENRRLKLYLEQIMKEYRSLQTKFYEIVNQQQQQDDQQSKKSTDSVDNHPSNDQPRPSMEELDDINEDDGDHQELISLSLGRSPSRELKKTSSTNMDVKLDSRLSLTLDCGLIEGLNNNDKSAGSCSNGARVDYDHQTMPQLPQVVMGSSSSPVLSSFEGKEESAPNKTGRSSSGDEEGLQQQHPAKKARVSVRARCDTPTMNDGCQWRKYGQKIAKGNPCPRAYYRCTVGPSCPVRKQVQRCADDMSILTTTYEGNHNHPLPMSATTMASTTSAAASMLLSGSSSSSPGNLHGLNMYISDNNINSTISRSSRPPFYFHTTTNNNYNYNNNSSPYSPSPAYPTITLDLTSNNNFINSSSSSSSSSSSAALSNLTRFSSRFAPAAAATSLNFGDAAASSSEPTTWGLHNNNNINNGILNYGIGNFISSRSTHANTSTSSSSSGPMNGAHNYRMTGPAGGPSTSHQSMLAADSHSTMVAAATKAITADPSFQSALAAALTSIIGNNNNNNGGSKVTSSSWGSGDQRHFPVATSGTAAATTSSLNVKATTTSAAANTTPSSTSLSRTGSLLSHNNQSAGSSLAVFQPPSSSSPLSYSLPAFAATRDASTSPSDNG